ncbi:MAG: FecR family protein [Acidobacteria bacterium]|nr:FecR family protein [Acidobacteriota bacterium]
MSTAEDGKAEILLNPGSYGRLGGNSAFEFRSTSLDSLEIVVDRGSVIFEVYADDDFRVRVKVPGTDYMLVRTGVYRIDVFPGQTPRIEVWKGRAQIGDDADAIVTGGRTATANGNNVAVAKFDRDDRDDLETWSRARSKELAKSIAQLERRQLRTSLMHSFLGRQWNMYNSFGVWAYNPSFDGYCFLPFGYGWSSPYGYGFARYIGWYNLPPAVYYPPTPTTPNAPYMGARRGADAADAGSAAAEPRAVPPFVRMQNSDGFTGRKPVQTDTDGGYTPAPARMSEQPVYIPPPSSGDMGARPGRRP